LGLSPARADTKSDDALSGYPDELKKYIADLYRHVDGLGVSADLKDDLKQEGVLYMLVRRDRLKDPSFKGFAPRYCVAIAWKRLNRHSSRTVELPFEPAYAGGADDPLRQAGVHPEDLDKYVRDLAEFEREHPDRLGSMIAASLVDHPQRDRVLSVFRSEFPKAAAEASDQLQELREAAKSGSEATAKAKEALRKRGANARKLWPWIAGALGVVILAVVFWNWCGGSNGNPTPAAPSPPAPKPAPL
jgi:hypothetical protein